jgi:hypothetical protein
MQFSIAPAQQQHQPQHTQNNIQQQQLSESFGQNSSASQPIMVSVTANDIASNDTSNLSATHMQPQQQSVAVVSTSGSLSSTSSFPGSVPPVANSGDPTKMVQTTPLLMQSPAENGEVSKECLETKQNSSIMHFGHHLCVPKRKVCLSIE